MGGSLEKYFLKDFFFIRVEGTQNSKSKDHKYLSSIFHMLGPALGTGLQATTPHEQRC